MSTILAIAAHPDDETMLAGGTLAMYAEQGHDLYILSTTRGEGGEIGDPPLATRETLGVVREAEMRCAATALGARGLLSAVCRPAHGDREHGCTRRRAA
ncbi:MAG TPA: PIG-L family deacetylase [Roseiflexaceae bacterium]|nr:PIG-L family deacetylase [Roseiflexaceae bacterium]